MIDFQDWNAFESVESAEYLKLTKRCVCSRVVVLLALLGVPDRMVAKCSFRGEWHNAKFTTSTTFKQLKKQLEEQFGTKLRIKFCDTDGDHVPVKRDSDWVDCVREIQAKGSNRMKLYLTERAEEKAAAVAAAAAAKEPTAVLSAQARADMFSMFEFILDPVLVISESGIIQYANKRVEAALGYTQADLIGRNISLMCPDDIKPYHDMYLKNYLKTKVSRIIGKGRDVIALKKDGSIHPIHLEVTEKSAGSGKVFFIGIMKEAKAQAQEKSLIQQEREVLYTFTVPAIIIDQTGAIHGFNKAAQDFLGYPLVEVIGKNVSMLMPSPHRELHDQYLKKYLETGEAKVIGVGRNAVAQQKDGTLVPVFLSVTEKRDKEKRFFTGILQEIQHTPSSTPQASPRG